MKRLIFHKNGYYSFNFNNSSVIAAFSIKRMNMAFNESNPKTTLENRKNFARSLEFEYRDLVCLEQVHSNRIVEAGVKDKGKGALDHTGAVAGTDGAITAQVGIPLAIRTADCLPLFFYDAENKAIGIAHAGYKGVMKEITKKLVSLMQFKYGTKPKNILVGIGPALRVCCYEVRDDFREYFTGYLENRYGKLYFDIIKANQDQLLSCGIKPGNIIDSGFCTACLNDKFFSWRREKTNNRMLSIIMLK